MDSYKGWGTQIDLEKTKSNRVLPRTDKELQLPRIIRVKGLVHWTVGRKIRVSKNG